MKKRTFLKLSTAIVTTAAVAPLAGCEPEDRRKNWAGNLEYSTDKFHEPSSVEELQELIRKLDKLRVQGTCHAFNTIADSNRNLVSLKKMAKVIKLDKEGKLVTVEAGMRYGELCRYLESEGFALHNLASLPHISIAGAIATATHGSGDGNGNLSTAVRGIQFVKADGSLVEYKHGQEGFDGVVVNLGALGAMTQITLAIEPTYEIKQTVYQGLPMKQLKNHFDEIFSSGYSVSLFTDWSKSDINQVWVKQRDSEFGSPEDMFGAARALSNLHPIESISAVNCTPQMGEYGPWHERLPHFKLDFTPSSGEELQAEYFVARSNAYDAIMAVYELRQQIIPLIQISEVRSIAADNLWMSMANQEPAIAIHFTLKKDWDGVSKLLPQIEKALAPFNARPHWAKLFTYAPDELKSKYPKLDAFRAKMKEHDPDGKFVNDFLSKYVA